MSDVGHREIKQLIEQVQNGTDDQKAVAAGVLGRLASIHQLPLLIASAGGIESLVVTWFQLATTVEPPSKANNEGVMKPNGCGLLSTCFNHHFCREL